MDLLCFCSVLCLLCFVRVCLYVLCGHLLGKGWPLGSRLWCLLWVCHFPIGILGQVWYLIVSIPDLCTITYFYAIITIKHSFLIHQRLLDPSWVVKTLAFNWFSCKAWNINISLFVQRRIHDSRRGDSDKLGRGSICRWSLIFLEYPFKNKIICSEGPWTPSGSATVCYSAR